MRSALGALLAAAVLALAGCGGGEESALGSPLGYLPEGAPVVASVETDTKGPQLRAVRRIAERFPFGPQLLGQLEGGELGPLLGNPLVFGVPDARALSDGRERFVGAVQVDDEKRLEDFARRQVADRGATELPQQDGRRIFRGRDGDFTAIDGKNVVFAGDRSALDRALRQSDEDRRMTPDRFADALDGLPGQALAKTRVDVGALLRAAPDSRRALRVPWVRALRTLGATLVARSDRLDGQFRVDLEGEVRPEDLPLAAGEDSPALAERRGEVAIALRDPSRLVSFAEGAGRAVDPGGFGLFAVGRGQIERRLGVSIDRDVLGQLSGDSSASIGLDGGYAVRFEVRDPGRFRRTLATLARRGPGVARGLGGRRTFSVRPPRGRGGLYLLDRAGRDAVFGMVGDVFVVGSDARRASALARARKRVLPGAQGALVLSGDSEQLARGAVSRIAGRAGLGGLFGPGLLLTPLGPLEGAIRSESDSLSGRFTQRFD